MNKPRVFIHSAFFVAFFAFGFLASLALHWSIRPTTADAVNFEQPSTADTSAFADLDMNTLTINNEQLKTSVASLETQLAKAEVQQAIDEGHARALIIELQTYRQERDNLFADLEQRKQQLENKVEQLDEKIQAQLKLREQQPPRTNYDIANELLSLLSYPHVLNDIANLNSALLEQSTANEELVQQRFELMLQQEDYANTDAIYEVLQTSLKSLNNQHKNNTQVLTVFCSDRLCEIQTQMQQEMAYFDYWQQWLTMLKSIEMTKQIQHDYSVASNGIIVGTVIIAL